MFAQSWAKLEHSHGSCFLVFLTTGIAALAASSCALVIERYIDSADWSVSSTLSALNRLIQISYHKLLSSKKAKDFPGIILLSLLGSFPVTQCDAPQHGRGTKCMVQS